MSFESKNFTLGQVNALIKQMGGEEQTRRFLRKELVLTEFDASRVSTWVTLQVGTMQDQAELKRSLKKANIKNEVEDFESVVLETESRIIDIVLMTPWGLGLNGLPEKTDILSAASKRGFELCPEETAFRLWLQYPSLMPQKWGAYGGLRDIIIPSSHRHLEISFREERMIAKSCDKQVETPGSVWAFCRPRTK